MAKKLHLITIKTYNCIILNHLQYILFIHLTTCVYYVDYLASFKIIAFIT